MLIIVLSARFHLHISCEEARLLFSASHPLSGHFLVRLARSWLVYLGASLDRDFASPGLLGVREDGPAGGGTFRDPVAEPRPGSRSRAYVSGPSAGGWPKVALMTQGGTQDETSPGHRAPGARNNGRKKSKGTPLVTDL